MSPKPLAAAAVAAALLYASPVLAQSDLSSAGSGVDFSSFHAQQKKKADERADRFYYWYTACDSVWFCPSTNDQPIHWYADADDPDVQDNVAMYANPKTPCAIAPLADYVLARPNASSENAFLRLLDGAALTAKGSLQELDKLSAPTSGVCVFRGAPEIRKGFPPAPRFVSSSQGRVPPSKIVPELLKTLFASPRPETVVGALQRAAAFPDGYPAIKTDLLAALSAAKDSKTKIAALGALGRIGDDEDAGSAIGRFWQDSETDERVRTAALDAHAQLVRRHRDLGAEDQAGFIERLQELLQYSPNGRQSRGDQEMGEARVASHAYPLATRRALEAKLGLALDNQ